VRSPAWWQQINAFINVGAVFDSLKCADIPRFQLPIPPLEEQRAIAGILGALDDKIELNRRMNETLEAMARALFKSWFVDFDPVRAKAESRDRGLPKPIADLFPACLIDSELGRAPEGWEVGRVDDEFDLIMGNHRPAILITKPAQAHRSIKGERTSGIAIRSVACFVRHLRGSQKRAIRLSVCGRLSGTSIWRQRIVLLGAASLPPDTRPAVVPTRINSCAHSMIFAHFEAEGTVFGSIKQR
jgi:hypothetical protein